MNWQSKMSDTIRKVTPYAFSKTRVTEDEEMEKVCLYIVQEAEDLMRKTAREFFKRGVLHQLISGEDAIDAVNLDLMRYHIDSLFEEFSKTI